MVPRPRLAKTSWLWVVWSLRVDLSRLWRVREEELGAVAARVARARRAEEVLGKLCGAVIRVGVGVVVAVVVVYGMLVDFIISITGGDDVDRIDN